MTVDETADGTEEPMVVQLDGSEVQIAVTEYLKKRGVAVEPANVRLVIVNSQGMRCHIVGCAPAIVVDDAKLPEGPYR